MPHKHKYPPIQFNNKLRYKKSTLEVKSSTTLVDKIDLLASSDFLKQVYSIKTK